MSTEARVTDSRLAPVIAALLEDTSLESVARTVVEAGARVCDASGAVVYLADDRGRLQLAASLGMPDELRAARTTMEPNAPLPLATAIRNDSALFFPSYEALSAAFPAVRASPVPKEALQAAAALPLRVRGKVIGGMAFSFSHPRQFADHDREFLTTLTSLAALAFERSQLIATEKQTRVDAEKERALLRSIFLGAPACIAILAGRDHRYELSNALNNAAAGGRELTGRTLAEALPELVAQGVADILDQVMATGIPFRFTEHPATVTVDGHPMTMFFNGVFQPLRGPNGTVDGVANFAFEVTEQVLARRRAEQAERATNMLAESIPAIVWSTDAEGRADHYNSRWYEYTGLAAGSLGSDAWSRVCHPEDLLVIDAKWGISLQTGDGFEAECRLLRAADNSYRWHLARSVPFRSHEGTVLRWFGASVDIDDGKRAADDQRRMAGEMRDALRVRDEFVSIAGHELRTPLTAMLMQVQGLERLATKEGGSARVLARLAKVSSAGLRLAALVDQLLDVSRMQAGRLDIDRQPTDLAALVREVVERNVQTGVTPTSVITIDAPEPLVGMWDKNRLDQVVTNLLSNAVKYGEAKPVDVTVRKEDDTAVLRVTDQGIGIAPDMLLRIFQRFERGTVSTDYGGIGVGLWITRQIVEASGGRIEARSQPGEGSTFVVMLPITTAQVGPS